MNGLRYTRPHPTGHLRDAAFGETEEADIEVVEVKFLDLPFFDETFFVGFDEALLFFGLTPANAL